MFDTPSLLFVLYALMAGRAIRPAASVLRAQRFLADEMVASPQSHWEVSSRASPQSDRRTF